MIHYGDTTAVNGWSSDPAGKQRERCLKISNPFSPQRRRNLKRIGIRPYFDLPHSHALE
jgi:hypothetical protein